MHYFHIQNIKIMQKKLQILLIACIALIATSCQVEEWTTGTLDYSFYPVTGGKGSFESGGVFSTKDIYINKQFDYVDQFAVTRSTLEITGDIEAGDIIRDMQIDVDGVGIFVVGDVYVYQNRFVSVTDTNKDDAFYQFMYNAFSYMSQYGKHDILVYGNLTKNGFGITNAKLKISFYNDLDVRIGNY